jgi:uncharacterized protein (DUF486 family)
MSTAFQTIMLLIVSNSFMTYAWYGHLRDLAERPWYVAAVVAWGVAFFEYQFQVPANRIGITVMTLPQLKILQEVITLAVFVPFSVLYMKASIGWDYFFASLCILGAVFFMFRGALTAAAA